MINFFVHMIFFSVNSSSLSRGHEKYYWMLSILLENILYLSSFSIHQVEHMLNDRLLQFVNIDLLEVKVLQFTLKTLL